MASRPSSTTGSAPGGGRESDVARVVRFAPRERNVGSAANDNARPHGRYLFQLLGPAVVLALIAGGWIYLYLS